MWTPCREKSNFPNPDDTKRTRSGTAALVKTPHTCKLVCHVSHLAVPAHTSEVSCPSAGGGDARCEREGRGSTPPWREGRGSTPPVEGGGGEAFAMRQLERLGAGPNQP